MYQNTLFQSIEKIQKNAKLLAIANLSPIILGIFALILIAAVQDILILPLIGFIYLGILIAIIVGIYQLGSGLKEFAVNLQLTQDRFFYKAGDNIRTAMTLQIVAGVISFIPLVNLISIILIIMAFFKELNGYTQVAEGFDYLFHRGMYYEKGKRTLRNAYILTLIMIVTSIVGVFITLAIGSGDIFAAFSLVIFLFIVIGLMGIGVFVLRVVGYFQLSSDIKKVRLTNEQQVVPRSQAYYQPAYRTGTNERGPSPHQNSYEQTPRSKTSYQNAYERETIEEPRYQNSYEQSSQSNEKYQNSYEKQTTPEKTAPDIFCHNCGATIPGSSMYCENCGIKV